MPINFAISKQLLAALPPPPSYLPSPSPTLAKSPDTFSSYVFASLQAVCRKFSTIMMMQRGGGLLALLLPQQALPELPLTEVACRQPHSSTLSSMVCESEAWRIEPV